VLNDISEKPRLPTRSARQARREMGERTRSAVSEAVDDSPSDVTA